MLKFLTIVDESSRVALSLSCGRSLTESRINSPSINEIFTRLAEIPWDTFQKFEHEELLAFYHPETLACIEGLRTWLLERQLAGKLDKTDLWIRMIAISRLTEHSSGFFLCILCHQIRQ